MKTALMCQKSPTRRLDTVPDGSCKTPDGLPSKYGPNAAVRSALTRTNHSSELVIIFRTWTVLLLCGVPLRYKCL